MNNSFSLILQNRILWVAAAAWASAQILKMIINAVMTRKLDFKRLMGDGGMPSAHSATVTSVAVAAGIICGFDSPVFAIAAILAFIVMRDAMGVRLETGKQAKVINDLVEALPDEEEQNVAPQESLKELVGHTPAQVFAGACLGLIIALVILV